MEKSWILFLALFAFVPAAALESSNACYMTCVASKLSSRGKRSIFPETLAKFCQMSDLQGSMRILVECVDECDADVKEDSYIKNFRAIISLCEKLQYDEKMTCVNEKTNLTDIEFDQLDNVCDFYYNWHQQHVASYVSCKFVAEEIIRVGNILGQMWSIQKNLDYKDLGSCVKEWPLTKIVNLSYSNKLDCLGCCNEDALANSVINKTINEIYAKNCHQSIQYKFDTFLNCYFNASKSEYVEEENPQDFCEIRNYYEKQCGAKKNRKIVDVQPLIEHFVQETAAEFYIDVDEDC
uniref:Uncharacterized protein n=1 Tax=Panagrolaimus sp. JU765 TaxID=591449 RepID=A0AC34PYN4_9BILA